MNFKELQKRAMEIRKSYAELEKKKYGRSWTNQEIALGFVGDVGDLAKLVAAKEKVRDIDNVDEKLSHELSDCLWSVLVLANNYDIDLEEAFTKTMNHLEENNSKGEKL